EHAHSPGIDIAISAYRDLSGCGVRLDVLGNRAEDVQAVSQERSCGIAPISTASPAVVIARSRALPRRAARVYSGLARKLRGAAGMPQPDCLPAGVRRRQASAPGTKNKAVDAVYRQRPCQPRILKSAHAIR